MTTKKRKLDYENRIFNNEWENKYYFIEFNGSLCVYCVTKPLVLSKNITLEDIMKLIKSNLKILLNLKAIKEKTS